MQVRKSGRVESAEYSYRVFESIDDVKGLIKDEPERTLSLLNYASSIRAKNKIRQSLSIRIGSPDKTTALMANAIMRSAQKIGSPINREEAEKRAKIALGIS